MTDPEKGRNKGGRPKGSLNKNTADIKALALELVPEALAALTEIVNDPKHPARMAASKEILDRAYGKPKQAIVGGDEGDAPIMTVTRIELVAVEPDGNRPT